EDGIRDRNVTGVQTCALPISWLQRRLTIKGQLPPLRGWATSPDVLLRLHTHIMATRPNVIVEFGSGASTLVIADALSQNGAGKRSEEHKSELQSRFDLVCRLL